MFSFQNSEFMYLEKLGEYNHSNGNTLGFVKVFETAKEGSCSLFYIFINLRKNALSPLTA